VYSVSPADAPKIIAPRASWTGVTAPSSGDGFIGCVDCVCMGDVADATVELSDEEEVEAAMVKVW